MTDTTTLEERSSMLPLYVLVLLGVIASAAYYVVFRKKEEAKGKSVDVDETLATNSVEFGDIAYIVSKLTPNSTPIDVLLAIASSPDSIKWSTKALENRETLIAQRLKDEKEETKDVESKDTMFDLGDDWADEDDEDDLDEEAKRKAQLARATLEEKKKMGEELAKATGKLKIPIEGLDEGVIGQKWVETTLGKAGHWPLEDLSFLKGMTFDYKGKQVSALDHPGLRRNLCFIAGRLNSLALNTHPELLQAASTQKIDPTYFKNAADFRARSNMLFEATLRAAVALRNKPLTSTVVEAVSLFKIGCKSNGPREVEWFDSIMMKQYGVKPRLQIENTKIENPKFPEMATGDVLLISLDLTRVHAEAFTKQKIEMLKKQGIPPQIGLQSYREGWWYVVTGERLDGETQASSLEIPKVGLLEKIDDNHTTQFMDSPFGDRLMTAWPMIVANIAQKAGKVKINFTAPSVPGKYRFHVSIKSQDFLGADQVFSVEATIVDASTVTRAPIPEEKDDEAKKDK